MFGVTIYKIIQRFVM